MASPTLYASMLQMPDVESRYDLSSLRLCVSAGEPLPGELFTRWKARFGLEILDGIGTTEALHIFLSNRAGQVRPGSSGLRSRAMSCGWPMRPDSRLPRVRWAICWWPAAA